MPPISPLRRRAAATLAIAAAGTALAVAGPGSAVAKSDHASASAHGKGPTLLAKPNKGGGRKIR